MSKEDNMKGFILEHLIIIAAEFEVVLDTMRNISNTLSRAPR